ncbi:MAG: alpha/beta fold hydrolase [Chloroflexi bacterium]|nr:alpha/beta fold hydrolase [Chloroflexota bacterium]
METKVQEKWVEVEGLRIHYLRAGEQGSPVLLLHGGGLDCASLSYRLSIGPISQHHRVFAPDWPGYGESDQPKVEYSTEYYVHFLGRLMDALGLERASLAGLSMGGGIALGFSLESPHRVEKLVLVDSYGLGSEVPWPAISYLVVWMPLLYEMTYAVMRRSRWMVRLSLQNLVCNRRVVTDDLVDEVYRLVKKPGVEKAFRSFQRSEARWNGLRTNFVDRLPELAVPTLILHGEKDRLVPVSWAERAHSLISGSELRVFPECGHWLVREKTEEFNRAVLEFLGKDG